MKKIVSLFCFAIFSICVFAQSSKYSEYLKSAKDAEAKKQWITALGSYMDAIEVDPLNSKEAVIKAKEITTAIANGKPGLGEFSTFELFEGWKNLFIDAEQYFTKNFPYEFIFGEWKAFDHDYKKKTADYKAEAQVVYTNKAIRIIYNMAKGYEKAKKDDWVKNGLPKTIDWNSTTAYESRYDFYNGGLNKKWPQNPVSQVPGLKLINESEYGEPYYSLLKTQKSYLVKGNAILAIPSYSQEYIGSTFKTALKEKGITQIYNAFALGTYDLAIKVTDGDKKIITPAKRYLMNPIESQKAIISFTIIAKAIPESQMSLFESQKAKPVVDGIYLQYGYVSAKDFAATSVYEEGKEGNFKKNLPEYSVSLSNAIFLNEKYTGNLFKTEVPWGEMSDTLNVLTYEDGNIKYNYDDLLYVLDKIVPSTEILEYEDDSVIMLLKCDSNSNSDYRYANILSLINGLETIYEAPYANSFSGLTNGYRVYNYRGDTPEDKFIFSKKGKISDKQGILYYVKKLSPEEKAKIVDSAKAIVASSNKKLESLKQVFGTDTEFYGVNDYEKKINELNKLVTDNAKATLIQAGTEALKVYDVASLEKKAEEYKLLLKSRTAADTLLKSSLTKINSYKESSIDYENYKSLLSEYETLYNDLLKVKDSRQKEEIDESTKKLSAFDATKIDAAKKEYEVLLNARKDAQKILEDTTAKVSTYKDDKYLAYDKYLLFLNECNTFASDLETAIKGFEVEKINNAKDKCAKIDYSNFDKLKEEYELILRNQKIQEGQDACKKFGFEVALSEEKYDEKTLFIITAVTKKGLADKGGMKVNDYYNTQSNAQSLEDFYIEFASLSSTKSFVIPVVEKTKKGDFKVKQVKIKQK